MTRLPSPADLASSARCSSASHSPSRSPGRAVPLIGVHHLAGHIESLVLEHGELPLPASSLVVSGGHTSLYRVSEPGRYELLGRTRDDAAGEAYDKVAKLSD
jgi:N6-L-threonylcarbamoyladenine synthase